LPGGLTVIPRWKIRLHAVPHRHVVDPGTAKTHRVPHFQRRDIVRPQPEFGPPKRASKTIKANANSGIIWTEENYSSFWKSPAGDPKPETGLRWHADAPCADVITYLKTVDRRSSRVTAHEKLA
jgi:hypothetical protein